MLSEMNSITENDLMYMMYTDASMFNRHCDTQYVIRAPPQKHAIPSRPYVALLTPSCSIHLIMGGG